MKALLYQKYSNNWLFQLLCGFQDSVAECLPVKLYFSFEHMIVRAAFLAFRMVPLFNISKIKCKVGWNLIRRLQIFHDLCRGVTDSINYSPSYTMFLVSKLSQASSLIGRYFNWTEVQDIIQVPEMFLMVIWHLSWCCIFCFDLFFGAKKHCML